MRRLFNLSTVAVTRTHVDVAWGPSGNRTRLYSYWLKLQGAASERYAGVAARSTDGANFHRDEIPINKGGRIEAAETGGGALRVQWRDGAAVQLPAEQVRRAVDNADAANVQPVLWNAETVIPQFEYEPVIELGNDEQLFRFLRAFLQHDPAFLGNLPRRPDQVAIAAAQLSTLQASHLGQTLPIIPAGEPDHLGETSDGIPLHIDMVYKQAPSDLQMLHVPEMADAGAKTCSSTPSRSSGSWIQRTSKNSARLSCCSSPKAISASVRCIP